MEDLDKLLFDFMMAEMASKEFCERADKDNIEKIASPLRIAYVDFIEYEYEKEGQDTPVEQHIIFYDSGYPRSENCIIHRDIKVKGGSFSFRAFAQAGVIWEEREERFVRSVVSILSMCKERIRMFEKLEYLTYHDLLTGLHNLPYGIRMINSLMGRGCINEYASIFLNIRNMTEINNMLGHDGGTRLMALYAREFERILGKDEAFWRIGGDNFGAIVLKSNVDEIISVIKGKDIVYGDRGRDRIRVSAVAGVYMLDGEQKSYSEILDGAQSSMSLARYVKHVPYLFYDAETIKLSEQSKSMETHFDEALKNGEFIALYQPKVALETGDLEGAEALCRWKRGGELIPASSFIPVLEKSKRICSLDFEMLRVVCADMKRWTDEGVTTVPVSVNFSRKHLTNPNLAEDIISTVDSYEVKHDQIVIEFTETASESDQVRLAQIVKKLEESGIRTSVDDFGSGYSSMCMIRDIPFNELKLDRSLIESETDDDDRSAAMMKHVIALADELGMSCIAEGAETEDQIKLLEKFECMRVQGFYFDKPLEKDVFMQRLLNPHYERR